MVCRPVSRDRTDHAIGRAFSWADLDPSARTRSRQLQAHLFQRNRVITECVALFALGVDEASLRGLMRD